MGNRVITCENQFNIKGIFSERSFPFLLSDADGLYQMAASVNLSSNTMNDGAVYHSSALKKRNIVLTLSDVGDHTEHRAFLNELFVPKSSGVLTLDEGSEHRKIEYYVESIKSSGLDAYRIYQVSLICPDPYFYDLYDSEVTMATFLPSFYFTHYFKSAGEEFGYRQKEKIRTIYNDAGIGGTGMRIEISCNGDVKNPSVTSVESNQRITVGTSSKPLNLVAGDRVIITTYDADKQVYLVHEGNTTKINQYLSEDSYFIQLEKGKNSIGYSAAAGVDNMIIRITYKIRYASA